MVRKKNNTFITTFGVTTLLPYLKVCYLKCKVDLFITNIQTNVLNAYIFMI